MANMDFYSRGDWVFVRLNRILEGMFTLSTLYTLTITGHGIDGEIMDSLMTQVRYLLEKP